MNGRAIAVITAGFLTVFTAFAVRYSYGLLLPEMLPSLAISKTEAGVVYSSYFITYTLFSPLLGLLADRYSIRIILTFFVTLLGIGTFLMSYSSSVLNASLFFALAGLGHSACWVPVVALIQRWVSHRRRGMALAVTDLGSGSGIAVLSLSMPLIVADFGWRAGWTGLGLLSFGVSVINFILVRDHPDEETPTLPQNPGRQTGESIGVTYKRLFSNVKFWLIGLSYLLVGFTVIIPYTFLTSYATEELDFAYGAATGLISAIAIAGIVGKIILGPLSDSIGRVKVMMLCGAIMAVGCLGLTYLKEFYSLYVCAATFGLGYGAVWAVYAASATDLFPKKVAGSVVGLWTFYLGIGSGTAPIISGWVIDTTGSYSWAFILAVASAVISSLLLLPIARAPSGSEPSNP